MDSDATDDSSSSTETKADDAPVESPPDTDGESDADSAAGPGACVTEDVEWTALEGAGPDACFSSMTQTIETVVCADSGALCFSDESGVRWIAQAEEVPAGFQPCSASPIEALAPTCDMPCGGESNPGCVAWRTADGATGAHTVQLCGQRILDDRPCNRHPITGVQAVYSGANLSFPSPWVEVACSGPISEVTCEPDAE